MLPTIEIQYRNVRRDILIDFECSIDKSIELKIYKDPLDHFDPPADVLIYVNEHLTEIVVGGVSGLLTSAFWDGLKMLWSKVVKKSTKKHCIDIDLNFKLSPDRTIEFHLQGNVDAAQINALVSQILKYLVDVEQQRKDFGNLELIDKRDSKPRLRVRYNPTTKQFKVVNVSEQQKRTEEMIRRLMDGLSS
jgi:hypothetical protein